MICAGITLATSSPGTYQLPLSLFGPPVAFWAIGDVQGEEWRVGFTDLVVPQVPLTTLNAVISICALADTLYAGPQGQTRGSSNGVKIGNSPTSQPVLSRKQVAISIGLMNGLFCLFGSMPNCHGAGGLAGQHRFGARNGASIMFLGIIKMLIAVFLGGSALTLFEAIPTSVLGVMLGIAGTELAVTGVQSCSASVKLLSKHELRTRYFVMLITAVVIVGTGKTHFGVVAGLAAFVFYGDGWRHYSRMCCRCGGRRKRTNEGKGDEGGTVTEDSSEDGGTSEGR